MTDNSIIKELAATHGITDDDTSKAIEAVAKSILKFCSDVDSVAIPGFGTFVTTKLDEVVVDDLSTGGRTLLPPKIEVKFKPSVVLRKKFVG